MSASVVNDALSGGVLLQQDNDLGRIVQLVAVALFLFGPVLLRVLQRLIGGARPGQPQARDPRARRRSERSNDPAADAGAEPAEGDIETKGRDLWRQLMELEERAEEEAAREAQAAGTPTRSASSAAPAAPPAPTPTQVPTQVRRPADPLADPDVELTQRRVQPRSVEALPPKNMVAEAPRAIPGLTPVLERVPDEDTVEAARDVAPLPIAALGDVAPPQLVERGSQALRRGPTREELRRVLVLREVLAPPVSLRAAGRGGHDPLA
jgi:hypothetical protein